MTMLLAILAAAATPSPDEARFATCLALTETDAEAAIRDADSWRIAGGGVPARQCLGLAYAAQKRWPASRLAFEQAAREAERNRDARSAQLWVQAGNAAMAGGDHVAARMALEAALSSGLLKDGERGEAHLDRARAFVALGQNKGARIDLDAAIKWVPQDPLVWLLSATLARRDGDLERASKDIQEAAKLSPDDPSVALEAGNIAILSGAPDAAKLAWQAAVRNAPESPAGKAAADALQQFKAAPAK